MILFFDTETTGFPKFDAPHSDPSQAHIVQLAALLLDEDFNDVAALDVIIRPDGWTVPDVVANIHGISTEKAQALGVPLKAAMVIFHQFLNASRLLVAHNISFDRKIIQCAYSRIGHAPPGLAGYCTMMESTPLCKLPKARGGGYKWPKLTEALKVLCSHELVNAHTAMADVRGCAMLYRYLRDNKPVAPTTVEPSSGTINLSD